MAQLRITEGGITLENLQAKTGQPDDELEALLNAEEPTPQNPVVVVRKPKKKKKGNAKKRDFEVQIIPATKHTTPLGESDPVKRVAAYCRVSTDEDAQATSFDLQVNHYTEFISAHDNWILAGIYADEGISGTQVKHREQFQRMIEDCEDGKIDMIITKSISRFARNTVDCLTTIRKLKALKNPVEIYFEKERLYSLDEKTDMVLSLMASIAQEESRSISANIRWAIRNRMKNGTQKIPTSALLGYDTDEDGNMVIISQEAEVVKTIYKSFVQGTHPTLIATRLNSIGAKTVYGNDWTASAVKNILQNEKYCGDVLMQKTITIDYLTHTTKINEGEAEQYYIADHHDAIVSRDLWNKAQELLNKQSWRKWKQRGQQRLIPKQKGRLRGFVGISPEWRSVSVTRLVSASSKVDIDPSDEKNGKKDHEQKEELKMASILEGFEVVELEESRGDSVMTLTATNLKFNKATAAELGFPNYIRMLVHAPSRKVAIEPCKENTKNAVPFSKDASKQTYAIVVKIPALLAAARKLADVDENSGSISFKGTLYPKEKIIIYDLSKGEPTKRRGGHQKKEVPAEVIGEAETSNNIEETTE